MNKISYTPIAIIMILGVSLTLFPGSIQRGVASEHFANLEDNPPPGRVFLPLSSNSQLPQPDWPMVAANPQRTSWTPAEVSGNLHVEWYLPIEAYISQNVQIIAANGLLYLSTARGLYAINAATGSTTWRFDTILPLGNSPTISNGIAYVGGYDRKLHALNALTGAHLWSFDGAKAGYDTNPLVVNGMIILGNRDGWMYAIGAHGTQNQGQLIWKFQAGGPIHLSAAYKNGIVYFAADDSYAYALNAANGSLIWKSEKLPGDGYHSFWPVIYNDNVIFSAAVGYRMGLNPGMNSLKNDSGTTYNTYRDAEKSDIFYGASMGDILGPLLPAQPWSNGYPVLDASRVTQYLEDNPAQDPHKYKPWRRTFIALNTSSGAEFTFDSDSDGHPEYMPIAYWGTNSGNRYPPVVGPDGMIYMNSLYNFTGDPQGKVMGWNWGTKYLSVVGGQAAIAEPQAISMGGNLIYRNLCCDRVGGYFSIYSGGTHPASLWSYDLDTLAPAYDDMWITFPGWPRLRGWYLGNTDSVNGIYHNHGDQNPLIPYMGKIFTHRSNTIIAYGSGPVRGKLPSLMINPGQNTSSPLGDADLRASLETEVSKIIAAGPLRPGYYNTGQFTNYSELANYFINPGDTLYTLSIAYPHLSSNLQNQLRVYLQDQFSMFFDPVMYSSTGWADGAPREATLIPPEVQSAFADFPRRETYGGFSWSYPPLNHYALWKYALIVPEQAAHIYDLSKSKLQVPVPAMATTDYFSQRPFELNAYIAGYFGFLQLQELAGQTQTDGNLRTTVTTELNRLLALRANNFDKDSPWGDDRYAKKVLNIAENFMMLVPELGDYMHDHAHQKVAEALSEYNYVAPYWFVSRYEAAINEGATSPLYNYPALFQAKAYILKENRNDLSRYLDAPAFIRGDLFYIQNLVATLNAPP